MKLSLSYYIGSTHIELFDGNIGSGSIRITKGDVQYSTEWNAMGDNDILSFVASIDSHYLSKRLLSNMQVMDVRSTFRDIRRKLQEEIPGYYRSYMSPLRKEINYNLRRFQELISKLDKDGHHDYVKKTFVDLFRNYVYESLNLYSVPRHLCDNLESELKCFCSEPWHHIVTKDSEEYRWMKHIHVKLKKRINKLK